MRSYQNKFTYLKMLQSSWQGQLSLNVRYKLMRATSARKTDMKWCILWDKQLSAGSDKKQDKRSAVVCKETVVNKNKTNLNTFLSGYWQWQWPFLQTIHVTVSTLTSVWKQPKYGSMIEKLLTFRCILQNCSGVISFTPISFFIFSSVAINRPLSWWAVFFFFFFGLFFLSV